MMDSREAFEKYRDECGKNGYQIPHWDEYQTFKDGRASIQAELEAVKQREAELMAHWNRVIPILAAAAANKPVSMAAGTMLRETPAQSLEAHDREVRNQQRREDIESIRGMAIELINTIERMEKDIPDTVNDINRAVRVHSGMIESMSAIVATIEKE